MDDVVSVLIPFRSQDPARQALWRYVQSRWEPFLGFMEVVEAADGRSGPWRKGVALRNALEASTGSIVVVTDADVWIPGVFHAIQRVKSGAKWVKSHNRVHRLKPQPTLDVLQGKHLELVGIYRDNLVKDPYHQDAAGAGTVMRREVLEDVPMDCRFAGWGSEDLAWAEALHTFYGPPLEIQGACYHLFHPPAPRIGPNIGSDASHQLRLRYRRAKGRPEKMRELVEAGREAYYDDLDRRFDVV